MADQYEVKSKVAIVTGAASGIGLAITRCLLKKGAKVCMVDINDIDGQKSLSSLQKEFPAENVFFAKVDISDTKQLTEMFAKTTETFGGLDIVCNNAGIVNGEKIWRKMFEVNVFSIIESISLAIEYMSTAKGGKGGVVVNTASLTGLFPESDGYAKYGATKHAVVGYTRALKSLAKTDGIRVNCICPGMVDTPPVQKAIAELMPTDLGAEAIAVMAKPPMLSPEQVVEGILDLITDTSKAGAVMAITHETGIVYPKLLTSLSESRL